MEDIGNVSINPEFTLFTLKLPKDSNLKIPHVHERELLRELLHFGPLTSCNKDNGVGELTLALY